MKSRLILLIYFALVFSPVLCWSDDAMPVRFDRDIRPMLSDTCFQCHGPDEGDREADLRLDLKENAFSDETGSTPFKPGKLDESEAWLRITSDDPDEKMPPPDSNKKLTPQQIDLFKRWIEQGAKWTEHWSFAPPKRPAVPMASDSKQLVNPIDHFIRARLDQEKLKASPEADRRILIRRLSFDLTGLPPKPAEVEQFVNDKSPDAYEKLVDRLLKSPHYGERMALKWLDLARYGDTSVFHADGPRDMWAWRDHIVRSYNANQPFDQFSTEQLAGDLIPNATAWQKVASGFNRNNGTTDEGGLIEEEYRVEYAVDRVKTTSTVWLGLTMECAQCHEHKYDPISQEDYYKFYAFFNISADKGKQTRNGNAAPIVDVFQPEQEQKLSELRKALAQQEVKIKAYPSSVESLFEQWVKSKEGETRTDAVDLLPSNPLLHFQLSEGKGNSVADSNDSKRKGSVKGKVQWVKSKFDQGLKFDGGNYVDLGNVANFERTDNFSYGGWINVEPKSGGALLARMDVPNSGYRGYDLLISSGYIEVHIINKWPENAIKVRTKKAIKPKEWHHVFATYDGSSKAAGVTIYVDGQPWEWDIQQNGLTATIQTKKMLLIGSRHGGSPLKGTVDEVQVFNRKLTAAEVQALAGTNPLAPVLAIASDKRTKEQIQTLRDYYLNNVDIGYSKLRQQRDKLKAEEVGLQKPLTKVMVMQDMPKPRDTFVLNRGAYDQPTKKKVQPGIPAVFPPMANDAKNRRGLANWLFQEDHPLTARVAVNRYWQMLFGVGLVSSPSDFGSQGEFPSHPELLDWLAVDFRESGWDIKRMIKQIVMSATYRQSSRVTPDLVKRDPDNRLLARGPRFRLQGDFIRDNALALSGLLVNKMGGPGVKPYQPPGLWTEVGLSGKPIFAQDHGDKLYRRSLYTYWKRSAPPPNMQIFDAPTREKCIVLRARTNTPLQALVTLNDVQFVEAARNLAQRMMIEAGGAPSERLAFAYLLAVSRKPRDSEQKVMLEVYEASLEHYRKDADAAKSLLSFGESKRDETLDAAQHAAWTVIASMILNFDETLTRG